MAFIVYALPRSRTAWLAEFLTYGDAHCGHEQAIYMRSIEDIRAAFRRPDMGSVETAAAQGHWLIRHYMPGIRQVVIRRPLDEVVASMLAIDLGGMFKYDAAKLRKIMAYGNRMLDEISTLPDTLTVDFADLAHEDACAAIFEHCLGIPFDRGWWLWMKDRNIQVSVPAALRYFHENRAEIEGFKRLCWRELRSLRRSGALNRKEMAHAVS